MPLDIEGGALVLQDLPRIDRQRHDRGGGDQRHEQRQPGQVEPCPAQQDRVEREGKGGADDPSDPELACADLEPQERREVAMNDDHRHADERDRGTGGLPETQALAQHEPGQDHGDERHQRDDQPGIDRRRAAQTDVDEPLRDGEAEAADQQEVERSCSDRGAGSRRGRVGRAERAPHRRSPAARSTAPTAASRVPPIWRPHRRRPTAPSKGPRRRNRPSRVTRRPRGGLAARREFDQYGSAMAAGPLPADRPCGYLPMATVAGSGGAVPRRRRSTGRLAAHGSARKRGGDGPAALDNRKLYGRINKQPERPRHARALGKKKAAARGRGCNREETPQVGCRGKTPSTPYRR